MSTGSPLYPLLNEINNAAQNGMPLIAVAMSVALPDICASLAAADGRTSGQAYKAWCNANLPQDKFSYITSDDLYSMRCGVLHQGRFGDMQHNVGRVIFGLPGNMTFQNCVLNDAYFYSVPEFCKNICDAVYAWFEANKTDANIQANLPRLMQYRNGFPPYVEGFTVLA
ncbi:hypothetical protein G6M50_37985 [Agrobacterium rhizogenes]|nr:hypothetical protein [Rhizobium rhizogenes]NTJ83581.1 hypothetical protein [Rhizobium rhizogenes]